MFGYASRRLESLDGTLGPRYLMSDRATHIPVMFVSDCRTIDELKGLGAGRPAPEPVATLYREAFDRFGTHALWSRAPSAHPTIAQALVVAESLRREGNVAARRLATRIEEACRAAV